MFNTEVYIVFEIHIFAPPPLLIYISSPTEIYYNDGVRAAGEKLSAFFCNLVYFKSIGENICILFTNRGKICISPTFNPFFPNLLFCHIFAPPPPPGPPGGEGQTEKYTTLIQYDEKVSFYEIPCTCNQRYPIKFAQSKSFK